MGKEMNAKQGAKLNMYRAIEKHIGENASTVASTPAFRTAFNKFKANIAAITDTAQQKSAALTGIAADKNNSKQTLCRLAANIAGVVYAYASANQNETLKQEMNLPVTTLLRTRDDSLAPRCQNIHDKAAANLAALSQALGDGMFRCGRVVGFFEAGFLNDLTKTGATALVRQVLTAVTAPYLAIIAPFGVAGVEGKLFFDDDRSIFCGRPMFFAGYIAFSGARKIHCFDVRGLSLVFALRVTVDEVSDPLFLAGIVPPLFVCILRHEPPGHQASLNFWHCLARYPVDVIASDDHQSFCRGAFGRRLEMRPHLYLLYVLTIDQVPFFIGHLTHTVKKALAGFAGLQTIGDSAPLEGPKNSLGAQDGCHEARLGNLPEADQASV